MGAQPQHGEWLERIVRAKRAELERSRAAVPQSALEKKVVPRPAGAFRNALLERRAGQAEFAIIAELKKASPSRGVLCAGEYDPPAIARGYQQAGARALSVLTDTEFFLGALEDLRKVKASSSLPVLRKDFTLAEYHVYEAAAAGADAILLIVAILQPGELASLRRLSRSLGLDTLVEVHSREELDVALASGSDLIGVNNRNLKTFEVSLNTSLELVDIIPDSTTAISESGLRNTKELERLRAAGFDAFLIGERFMTERDPGAALKMMLSGVAARETVAG
jgi:indole-3-glycerol phosphate synthase